MAESQSKIMGNEPATSENPPNFRKKEKTRRQSVRKYLRNTSGHSLNGEIRGSVSCRNTTQIRSFPLQNCGSKMSKPPTKSFDGWNLGKNMKTNKTLLHLEARFRRTNCLVLGCLDGLMFCWHFGFQVRVSVNTETMEGCCSQKGHAAKRRWIRVQQMDLMGLSQTCFCLLVGNMMFLCSNVYVWNLGSPCWRHDNVWKLCQSSIEVSVVSQWLSFVSDRRIISKFLYHGIPSNI